MSTGACCEIFLSLDWQLQKPEGRKLPCQSFIHHFFKIVLYRCLDLTRYNIGIPIPFSHHVYLSAIFKEWFTGFAGEVSPRPHCLEVSTTPKSYVPFDWSVISILNSGVPQQVVVAILSLCYKFLRRIHICMFVIAN